MVQASTGDKTADKPIGRVKDARGREVSQLDPYAMHISRRRGCIPPEELEKIARDIGIGLAKGPRALLIIGLICLAMVVLSVGMAILTKLIDGSFNFRQMFRTLVPLSTTWCGPLILWLGAMRIRSQKTKRVMLDRRRCPHCGYDLRGLPTDPTDDATVCPECGCAWLLPAAPS